MVGHTPKTGKAKPTRAERRAVNKAASAQRHADREVRKKRTPTFPSFPAGHALGAGAGAQEGGMGLSSPSAGGAVVETGRPGAGVVVLADRDMSPTAGTTTGIHLPTDEKRQAVVVMRANGFTKKAIAAVLGIDDAGLGRAYAFEIEHGFALVATRIASAVTLSALNGDQKDQHFWLRSKLGWGGERAVNITMGVMEAQISPNANKPFGGGPGLPAPGPNGKIHITMRLGIPDDTLGEHDEDGADD